MVTHDQDLTRRVSRAITVADGQIADEVKNISPEVVYA